MYADIIVDISNGNIDRTYQYHIPERMESDAVIGAPVIIPFGNGNRSIQGYIVGLSDHACLDVDRIKDIIKIENNKLAIESRLIALAYWIKEQFGATMNDCLRCVIPVKRKVKELQRRSIAPVQDSSILRDAYENAKRKGYKAQERLLRELMEVGEIEYSLIVKKLNISPATINRLAAEGLVELKSEVNYRSPVRAGGQSGERILLNEEQRRITDSIIRDITSGKRHNYLIHGVTGSGKTEVYMEIIDAVISKGRQVIMLIPEIALTYQTVKRFYMRFGDRISVINSKLSDGERYDQSIRAKKGEADIVIGPRSALFTPFEKLGLIIIDEEHEGSYKNEGIPRYHTREVAYRRAGLEGASVILGSATPSLEAYSAALRGDLKLFTLDRRAGGAVLPEVHIADMREELKNRNRTMFSMKLRELIRDRLEKREQVMLFLNRRGYSGFISCRSCGHVIKCPHCDISLTLHRDGSLMCHYCGHTEQGRKTCPSCGSKYIGAYGVGTQKVEEQIQKEFPSARILRMDADTTKSKTGHEDILSAFSNGEADILVGTQMIVKGHDFPDVTLVGILLADMSLFSADYRSAERTYQLLSQASGRAGRGRNKGEVVIQTYNPDNYCIKKASENDYTGFYNEEIEFRRLLRYPPISNLLMVICISREEIRAVTAGERIREYISGLPLYNEYRLLGPAPASIAKANDLYRQVLYIRNDDYSKLVKLKNMICDYILDNRGMAGCNIQFDFNPVNMV